MFWTKGGFPHKINADLFCFCYVKLQEDIITPRPEVINNRTVTVLIIVKQADNDRIIRILGD